MTPEEICSFRRFEAVAIGCHEHARQVLDDDLVRFEPAVRAFHLVEYFCEKPIPISGKHLWESTKVYFPFIRRVLSENQFQFVYVQGEFRLSPRTESIEKDFEDPSQLLVSTRNALVGGMAFSAWTRNPPLIRTMPDCLSIDEMMKEGYSLKTFEPNEWKQYFDGVLANGGGEEEHLARTYGLVVHPYIASARKTLMIAYPLATAASFFGYLMFLMPVGVDDEPPKQPQLPRLAREVWNLLAEEAKERYVPVLINLHESLLEERILNVRPKKEWKKACGSIVEANSLYSGCLNDEEKADHQACPDKDRPYSGLERALHRLWIDRQKLTDCVTDDAKGWRDYEETLVLARYTVSSPGVVGQLKTAMTSRLQAPNGEGQALPAALIYGGPGSGKDAMAKIVRLFSGGYVLANTQEREKLGEENWVVPVHTVNMASIRPSEITGPLLQGMRINEVTGGGSGSRRPAAEWNVHGLLTQAAETPPYRAVFILDELNSLDIDLQGILLRIIENGEVVPLGGLKPHFMRHMIIGVVNEDPEEISREGEMRDVLAGKGKIGGIVSALLYEVFRTTRRLRDDLYHRLKRNVYIRLPALYDRREDIPILFHAFLSKEERWKDVVVEFRVYQLLMSSDFRWPGNVRQVQSVAEKVRRRKENEPDVKKQKRISYHDVYEVLNEEFTGPEKPEVKLGGRGT